MTTIVPAPQTVGQHIDAALKSVGAEVNLGVTKVETVGSKAWSWITSEWHNLVTAGSVLYMALKAAGKL